MALGLAGAATAAVSGQQDNPDVTPNPGDAPLAADTPAPAEVALDAAATPDVLAQQLDALVQEMLAENAGADMAALNLGEVVAEVSGGGSAAEPALPAMTNTDGVDGTTGAPGGTQAQASADSGAGAGAGGVGAAGTESAAPAAASGASGALGWIAGGLALAAGVAAASGGGTSTPRPPADTNPPDAATVTLSSTQASAGKIAFDVTLGADKAVGDVVQLKIDGVKAGAAITVDAAALSAGKVTVELDKSALGGAHNVTSVVTDAAGNVGAASAALAITNNAAAVADGYLSGASVYADMDNSGTVNGGDIKVGVTDASGNFDAVLDASMRGHSLLAVGGTDISTGLAFKGMFTAAAGSTSINPLTTLVDAIVKSHPGLDFASAQSQVASALGLPSNVDLKTFDPLAAALSADGVVITQAQAIAIQAKAMQVANLISAGVAALDGATTATVNSAQLAGKVAASLAGAVSAASGTGTGVDLLDSGTLSSVLNSAASASGIAVSAQSVTDTANAVASANQVVGVGAGNAAAAATTDAAVNSAAIIGALSQMVQAQTVVQGAMVTALAAGTSVAGYGSAAEIFSKAQQVDLSHSQLGAGSGAQAAAADTLAPTIVSVGGSPSVKPFKAGEIIKFTVNLSEGVLVAGSPTLDIALAGKPASATYDAAASTSTALVFSYQVPANVDGALTVTGVSGASIADLSGNALNPALNGVTGGWSVDTSAPVAPSAALATDSGAGDGLTNVGTVNLSGLETGASWQYSLDGGANWLAGAGGALTLAGDGAKSVTLRQSDAAGNLGAVSKAFDFTLDTGAAAPTLTLALDSGKGFDGVTKVGTVNVAGLEAGASWQYSLDAGASWTAGSGASIALSGDGAKSVIVRQTDVAGNTSVASGALAFTLDTAAAAPTVALATDSGVAGDGVTNVGAVHVTGLETGASWEYSVDAGASWSVGAGDGVTLAGDGVKSVTVRQTDAAGNTSAASGALAFTLDATAPLAHPAAPADEGLTLGLAANLVLGANETLVKGTGTVSLYKAGDILVESIDVNSAQVVLSGTGAGSQISINPGADLVKDQAYYVKVSAGAFTDAAGNGWAGIADAATWNFTGAGATVQIGAVATDDSVNLAESAQTLTVSGTLGAEASVLAAYTVADMTAMLHPASGADIALGNLSYVYTSGATGAWSAMIAPSALAGVGDYTLSVNFNGKAGAAAGIAGIGSKVVHVDTVVAAPSLNLVTDSGVAGDGITNVGAVHVTGLETGASWEYSVNAGASWSVGAGDGVTLAGDGFKSVTVRQTDAAGNTSAASGALAFTLDATAPLAHPVSPLDEGLSQGLAANLILGANEPLAKGTGTVSLYKAGDILVESIDVNSAQVVLSGTGAGSQISINPGADLVKDQAYYVKVSAGAFTDAAGNAWAGIADAATWNFAGAGVTVQIGAVALDDSVNLAESAQALTVSGTLGAEASVLAAYTVADMTAVLHPASGADIALGNLSYVYTSGATGAWSAAIAPSALAGVGDYTLSVNFNGKAGAAAGIAGVGSKLVHVDTVVAAPSLNLVTDSGVAGDGVTSVGAVHVTGLETGASWEYSVNAGASWSVGAGDGVTLAGDGAKSVTVRQTDAAGNTSAASGALAFTLDSTAPSAPTITLTTDSGAAGDGVTNAGAIHVAGLETGASWEFSTNGTTWSAGSGASVALSGDGAKSVAVRQIDVAGNTGPASNALAFTLDTAAAAPKATLATDSGVAGDGITNVGTLNVSGLEAGASWEYSSNAGATWSAGVGSAVTLSGDGDKSVTLRQTDVAGNTSVASGATLFTLDTTVAAPTATLAVDSGVSAADGITNVGTVNLAGLESGASWQYSTDGGNAWASGSGAGFTLNAGNYAANAIAVRQIDVAGNLSALGKIGAAITVDTAAPTVQMAQSASVNAATGASTLAFTFSEAVTGFDASDIVLTNGSKGTFAAIDASHYSLDVTPVSSTMPLGVTVSTLPNAATDNAGNAAIAATQLLEFALYGTAGNDILTPGTSQDTIFLGAGNDVIKLAAATVSTTAATDHVFGFGGGDKIDLSALLGAGGSGYKASALADTGAGFIELNHVTLTQDAAHNWSVVNFDVKLDAASIGGSKIDGINLDLEYDASKVLFSEIISPQYLVGPSSKPVWTPLDGNFLSTDQGANPTGKIAMPANTAGTNPIIVDTTTGSVLNVKLYVAGLVDTFGVGIQSKASGGSTDVHTANGVTTNVEVGIAKTAGGAIGSNGVLEIVTDSGKLGVVGDNQLHMLSTYDLASNTTHLQVQYDVNPTFGTGATMASNIIALDFSGDVTANLTPSSLAYI